MGQGRSAHAAASVTVAVRRPAPAGRCVRSARRPQPHPFRSLPASTGLLPMGRSAARPSRKPLTASASTFITPHLHPSRLPGAPRRVCPLGPRALVLPLGSPQWRAPTAWSCGAGVAGDGLGWRGVCSFRRCSWAGQSVYEAPRGSFRWRGAGGRAERAGGRSGARVPELRAGPHCGPVGCAS